MKPTRASHNVPLPPRPVTAPAAAGYPPPPSGAPSVATPVRSASRSGLTLGTLAPEALPVSVAALATPTRRGSGIVPLGVEVTSGGCFEPGRLATPKNSDRQMRVMMPRSLHSIRQNVIQARAPEDSNLAAEPAMPTGQVPVPGTPASRCGVNVTPLGIDVADDLPVCHSGPLATPKNSERASSGCTRVMMPRSSYSMRNTVIQARKGEQADIVPDMQPPATASCGTPSRRSLIATPPPMGDEVIHSTVNWDSGPLATPKNGERRDLNGSVQLMAPLWRGSATTPLGSIGSTAGQVQPPSPTASAVVQAAPSACLRRPPTPLGPEVMQVAPVAASAGTPMRRSPTPLSVEVASNPVATWVSVATPKNSDRRDLSSSIQLNVPLWRGSAVTPVGAS